MPRHGAAEDDDDYVANLLKQDAANLNRGLNVSRRSPHAPRANTRFLQTILRNTTQHNAALLAKEQAEAHPLQADDGEISAKRAHTRHRTSHTASQEESGRLSRSKRRRSTSPRRHAEKHRERRYCDRSTSPHVSREQSRHHHRSDHRHRRRSASPQPRPTFEAARRHHSPHRSKDESPRRSKQYSTLNPGALRAESPGHGESAAVLLNAPRRGRGAFSSGQGGASIDKHFGKQYDPTMDLQAEMGEGADWDDALDAMRARALWRASGAERLKAAGFDDEAIMTWKKGSSGSGAEGDVDSVKWRTRGEGREWDRGKVLKLDSDHTGTDVEIHAGWNTSKKQR